MSTRFSTLRVEREEALGFANLEYPKAGLS
jgi:hypothetical protein